MISHGNRAGRKKKVAPRANKAGYGKVEMGPEKTIRVIYVPVEDPNNQRNSLSSLQHDPVLISVKFWI